MMSEHHNPFAVAGKVVGLAVGASALFGTVITMFGNKESKQEQVQATLLKKIDTLESSASHTLQQLNDVVEDLRVLRARDGGRGRAATAHLSRSASRQADRVVAAVLTKAQELEQDAKKIGLVESANSLGTGASAHAQEVLAAFKERSVDLLAEGKRLAPEWKNATAVAAIEARERSEAKLNDVPDVKKQASKIAHDVADRAPDVQEKGHEFLNKALHLANDLAAQMKEKAPDLQAGAVEIKDKATHEADSVSTQIKERTPALIEGIVHQIAAALAEAQKSAKPVVKDAASGVVEQVRHIGDEVGSDRHQLAKNIAGALESQKESAVAGIHTLGSTTTQKLANTGSAVETRSREAAVAAGQGTREFGALIGWTMALGGVIYYAFLKPHHRQKVKESAKRIGSEALGVVQDIRGQNGQF